MRTCTQCGLDTLFLRKNWKGVCPSCAGKVRSAEKVRKAALANAAKARTAKILGSTTYNNLKKGWDYMKAKKDAKKGIEDANKSH